VTAAEEARHVNEAIVALGRLAECEQIPRHAQRAIAATRDLCERYRGIGGDRPEHLRIAEGGEDR
jgi:hypothetical protein